MRHADDDLLAAVAPSTLDRPSSIGIRGFAALEGEALLPDITSVHELLDAFGRRQHLQYPAALRVVQLRPDPVDSTRCWIQRFSSVR